MVIKMLHKKIDINQQIEWCFTVLQMGDTWIYKYPMSRQYDVYNDELNCFEIDASKNGTDFVLTVDDHVFDSVKYNDKVRSDLERLWNKTHGKYEMLNKQK